MLIDLLLTNLLLIIVLVYKWCVFYVRFIRLEIWRTDSVLNCFCRKTNLKQSWQLEHFEHTILIWPDLINNITTTDVEQKTEIKTTGRVRCGSIRHHPGFQDIGNYNKRRWRIRSSFSSKSFIHIQDDIFMVIQIKITRYTRHRYESVNRPDVPIIRQTKPITSFKTSYRVKSATQTWIKA